MEVCRICLDFIYDKSLLIENDLLKMINKVLPETNLKISSNPVACMICTDSISELYKFQTKYFENEQRLKEANTDELDKNIDLKELIYGINLGEIVLTQKTKDRICRTCFGCIDGESFTVLRPSEPDAYLTSMLMCLPDMNLELCEDPVMCQKCLNCLQKLYNFKTSSFDVEEKLKKYCLTQNSNDTQINLHKVVESFVTMHQFIKVENEVEEQMSEEHYDENFIHIKQEDMEIKQEETPEVEDELNDEIADQKESKLDEIMKEIKKNHKNEIHYSCGQCSFTMANRRHYVMHMLSVHTTFHEEERLMHFCHLCNFKTMYKDQMKKHIVNEHIEKEKLSCPFCSFTSLYPTNLRRHISIHEDMQNLTCSFPQCDFKTSYKHSLQRHELKIHGNQCSMCSFKNRNPTTIQRHLRTVHAVYEIHQCNRCSFKTFYLKTLKRHNAREHKNNNKYHFTSVKKKKDELTAEEEEEIKNLFKN